MEIKISLIDDKGDEYYGEMKLSKIKKQKSNSTKKMIKKSKRLSLANAITDLISEDFFDNPKNLSEIIEKLKANAVFYPKTSFPESLLRLVKSKKLRRLKENKKWVYVKYG